MSPGLPAVIIAGSVISAGNGLVMPELIGAGLTEVRPDQAGIGAGMLTTAQQFAGSAGVTVIGSVFFAVLGEGYPAATRVAMLINLALVLTVAALVAFIAIHAPRPVPTTSPPTATSPTTGTSPATGGTSAG